MAESRQLAYDKRRIAAGWRRAIVWLDAEAQAALAKLVTNGASEQETIRQAIKGAHLAGMQGDD